MKTSNFLKQLAVPTLCAAALSSGAAYAAPIPTNTSYVYQLTSTSALPDKTTLATVTLTQASASQVDVRVALASGYYFAATSGSDSPTFGFSLFDAYRQATVSYTGTDFSVMSNGLYNLTPDGKFTNGFRLASSGMSAKVNAPLDFSIILDAGISLDAFAPSGQKTPGQPGGFGFAAHIGNQLGSTGSIGFLGLVPTEIIEPIVTKPGESESTEGESNEGGANEAGPAEVPEPASLALMGLGLAGLTVLRKRRKI